MTAARLLLLAVAAAVVLRWLERREPGSRRGLVYRHW